MSERMDKLVQRREKIVKDFREKIASYELNDNSSTEGCAYSYHEECVFLYIDIN